MNDPNQIKDKKDLDGDGIADVEMNKSITSKDDEEEDDELETESHKTNAYEKLLEEIEKEDREKHSDPVNIDYGKWSAKIARYLAYCIDGGVLCS